MIIIISGSINSGKSTVAKLLAQKLGNTAHIEVDSLRQFVDFMPLDQHLINMNLENAALVAGTFIKEGLNVVITYPLTTDDYKLLTGKLEQYNVPIKTFTLSPSLEVAANNRGERKLSDWERERIKQHYQMGISKPTYQSVIIDNSTIDPNETVELIFNQLKTIKMDPESSSG